MENIDEKMKEINDIIAWLSDPDLITKIDMRDYIRVIDAQFEMIEKIKPIYLKSKMKSDDKFIVRL